MRRRALVPTVLVPAVLVPVLVPAVLALASLAASLSVAQDEPTPERPPRERIAIPEENDPRRRDAPPRPPEGDLAERAAQLFAAIQRDDPASVRDFFFPREPFSVLKGIANPDRYWNVLIEHYERDIHELHASLPGIADGTFDRFVMSRRGGWVEPRQEANALPYWACRHSWIYYRAGGREQRFEIRTLINWGPRWYITHLR